MLRFSAWLAYSCSTSRADLPGRPLLYLAKRHFSLAISKITNGKFSLVLTLKKTPKGICFHFLSNFSCGRRIILCLLVPIPRSTNRIHLLRLFLQFPHRQRVFDVFIGYLLLLLLNDESHRL